MIGVLSLQGAINEHQKVLDNLGVDNRAVLEPTDLEGLDGLIIPGGESTAIKKLMVFNGLFPAIKKLVQNGLPTFGTCAGMVLLSQPESFDMIDATVVRNGFGRQQQSFEEDLAIQGLDGPFHAVFIRAPYLTNVGSDVKVLAKIDDQVVAATKDNVLATAFHPELTPDSRLHKYFIENFVHQTV
ncbi:pyridoxal 5'-phosphate synthase glutaminase subunit PdxT [Lentilactobacillus parafarraginis]|jgi:5'-phosphate synthase pdxT subunit|uniref:Pyridoxal 5'-phosphate synthase subunit PdxT n=3 Tax=Lentilactobacillus parafarraginis TaxID=390842 RepID=A0A0R1YFT4_9LACO|nr:pyridoxal 5'-phosphate synthase glutaminase subunit PdxT [Lentilactobacillus parafarraginis]KRM41342.1 pyridoxal 5-phosphate synthase, glutaminase subunit Pdx2 [Lentilactobacillus parafarraginis DSM 18390 = JCM 14109]TLQ21185.1 pyridoxal 5'-phosphate synthase glutaminase subunit PdxT [Lentilactobacillus parafarraginis]